MRSGAVPDEIAVIGRGLINDVKEFYQDVNVIVAPAFRNQNVWEKTDTSKSNESINILVALPIDLGEAKKIIKVVCQLKLEDNINLLIKPHPTYGPVHIENMINANIANTKVVTGHFKDFLNKSSLVISNASITPVEAIAKGIPALILSDNNGIVQNPIPHNISTKIWKLCFTVEETQKAIDDFLEENLLHSTNFTKIGKEIRENYFEPLTVDSAKRFLKLN